jgi:DNA modification methylase
MKLELHGKDIPNHLKKYFTRKPKENVASGYKRGDLINIPHLVSEALRKDGWVLRQDIVWHKPSPMPESVDSRCTKSHEYIFLLTKSMDYFYDAEAIKEGATPARRIISGKSGSYGQAIAAGVKPSGNGVPGSVMETGDSHNKRSVWSVDNEQALVIYLRENHSEILEQFLADARNKSDVWRVASQPYPGAHYATFPKKLIEPCILAGTSSHGACVECGAPWYRWIGKVTKNQEWRPTCHCKCEEVRPCIVLDPFIGSGTTIEVCIENNRWGWGIDLSEVYLKNNAIPRISACINERPALRHLLPQHEVKRVMGGRSSKRTPPPSS